MRIPLLFALFTLPFMPSLAGQTTQEMAFLTLINEYRAASPQCWDGRDLRDWPKGAQRTLSYSASLSTSAYQHNVAMIASDCTDHTCPGEPSLAERVTLAGYPAGWNYLSENIAGGFETAQDVMGAWQQSTGHNRTMLHCRSRAIGISTVFAPDSLAWWYWTTDFGDLLEPDGGAPAPPSKPAGTVFQALDTNGNHRIDDEEMDAAIDLWVTGTPAPGHDRPITDEEMTQLTLLWISGQRI